MMSQGNSRSGAGSFIGSVACALLMLGTACSPELSPPDQELPVIDLPPAEAVFGERGFSWVKSVRELSDGRLLVSDGIERFLYVVDFRSGTIAQIGSHGDGPGEYQWPGYLYPLGTDSTLFVDTNVHRWFLMVGERIVKSLDQYALMPILLRGGTEPLGVDRLGRVLGTEGFAYQPGVLPNSQTEADSVRILLSESSVLGSSAQIEAGQFDTVAEVGGQGLAGVMVEQGLRPLQRISQLATQGQAWLFPDGWIAVAQPEPYRVDWRKPDGQWIRGAPLPFTPVAVTHEEKCFRLSRVTLYTECWLDRFPVPWPRHVPPFVRSRLRRATPGATPLRPAPGGMLLILRTPTLEAPGNRYDVIDRAGELRGVLRLPQDQSIVGFGGSSLFIVQEDEMGLQTLKRHPWPLRIG